MVAAEISSTNPDRVANKFSELLGRDLDDDRTIALDDSHIRFVEGPAGSRDRLTGIDMTATDRNRAGETFEFARTVVRLV